MKRFLFLLPPVMAALACGGLLEGAALAPDDSAAAGGPALEIVNASDVEICYVYVDLSGAEEWATSVLAAPLAPGERYIYSGFEPGTYDVLALSCDESEDYEDDIVDEDYGLSLDEETTLVWEIGVGVADAAQGPPRAPFIFSGALREAECPTAEPLNAPVVCGYLTVPENRSDPDSNTIELAVAVLPSETEPAHPPLVFLTGGPGQGALALDLDDGDAAYFYRVPYMAGRDVVWIDQRGTGYSIPSLNCEEVEEAETPEAEQEAVVACRDRLLADGVDLTAYNSAENAADIADLIEALGAEQADLHGTSYGTRLALTIMRDRPERIRAVVLDSVFPPVIDTPRADPFAYYGAIVRVFEICAADPACAEAYPDPAATLRGLVSDLNAEPKTVTLTDTETGETYEIELYGDAVVATLTGAMYAADEALPLIPRAIYDAAEDDFAAYDALVAVEESFGGGGRQEEGDIDRSDSEGMYYSVMCRDEYAFTALEEAQRDARNGLPAELADGLVGSLIPEYAVCEVWGAGKAEAIEEQAVTSDIPTLILAGYLDPATPSDWAREAAASLSRAVYVEFPYGGHALTDLNECSRQIVTDFLTAPDAPPDISCAVGQARPAFILPGDDLP